jgi:hypothetical protein
MLHAESSTEHQQKQQPKPSARNNASPRTLILTPLSLEETSPAAHQDAITTCCGWASPRRISSCWGTRPAGTWRWRC